MSYHDPSLPQGAQGVARLADASERERRFVAALRLWLSGPSARSEVSADLAAALGPTQGRTALRAFEAYLEAVAEGVTRKLWRHRVSCVCLGRDEAALAGAVEAAARADLEGAYAALNGLVRIEALPRAVQAAGALGRALEAAPQPMEAPASRAAGSRRLH